MSSQVATHSAHTLCRRFVCGYDFPSEAGRGWGGCGCGLWEGRWAWVGREVCCVGTHPVGTAE